MAAYLIASVEITDPAGYEEYRQRVPATIAAFNGRYLSRVGTVEVLEGDWTLNRVVILEFPDMSQLMAWYESPIYKPLREIRNRTAKAHLVAIEGLPSLPTTGEGT
jgi:uncharacterized protein (DUF1330 family)